MSAAVNTFLPLRESFTLSTSESESLNLTLFKFWMISAISSLTPVIVENSCNTPSTFTFVIAAPGKLVSKTRLNAFPTVTPYPLSRGCRTNLP